MKASLRRSTLGFCRLALGATIVAHGGTAWAKSNAVALYVEGADAIAVRRELASAIPDGTIVVEQGAFVGALIGQGQKGLVGKGLDGPGHGATVQRLRGAASASGADAVLVARVTKGRTGDRVRFLLVDASGGEEALADVVLDLKGDTHDGTQIATLGPSLDKYKPPPPPPVSAPPVSESSVAVVESPESPDSTSQRPRGNVVRSMLQVELGGEAAARNFYYNQPITGNLRSYNVLPAAMFTIHAEVYPLTGASFSGAARFFRDVGLVGGFSRTLFLDSSVAGSQDTVGTAEMAYQVGLRVRIHPWGDDGTMFGISDSYADQSFEFGATEGTLTTQVPSVDYQANRAAVDARIPVGRFAFLADFGFRAVLSAGGSDDVAGRFSSSPSVDGIDAELGGALTLARGWEARLILDYERYFYSFSPKVGDAYVAGGALDQFYGARLALAWVY